MRRCYAGRSKMQTTVEFEFDDDVIQKVIEIFPKGLVLDVAREEPAELIQAICKVCRYGLDSYRKAHLVEEMADTLIVIRELQKLFDIPDEDLQEFITSKQMRTKERIRELRVEK